MKESYEVDWEALKGRPLARFWRLLHADRKDIFYLYVYAILNGLIQLTLPLGIQAIINLITGGQVSTSWAILVTIVILGIAVTGGLQIMMLAVTENLQQRIFTRSAFEFAFRIPRLRLEAIFDKYAPELMNRFFDTLALQKGLSKILLDFSRAGLQIFFSLILLSFYHPFFVAFGLALLVVLVLIFWFTGPQGFKTSLVESKVKYKIAHWLEEMARNIGTFKLAGETDLVMSRTDSLVTDYLISRKKHFRVLLVKYGLIVGFKTIVASGLLILGSLLVINNQMNIGQFVAAEIVIILLLGSVEKLILSLEVIYDVLTAVEKIGEVTDIPLENEEGRPFTEVDNYKGMEVQLRDLSFTYPGGNEPVLKNLNLHIRDGEKVCITGLDGSGKSTLLQVMGGLYEEFEGSVSYNGIPLGNLDLTNLRTYMGDSLSHEHLFEGNVEENISMGRKGVTFHNIVETAKLVGVLDYIQELPEGFNTQIVAGGKEFPKTVVRKLILARSLVCEPRILFLKDFLIGFAKEERETFINMLTGPDHKWTLVAVSQDPYFMKHCDRIIEMVDGRLIEHQSSESFE